MKTKEQLFAALQAADRARDELADSVYAQGFETDADDAEAVRLEDAYRVAFVAHAGYNPFHHVVYVEHVPFHGAVDSPEVCHG